MIAKKPVGKIFGWIGKILLGLLVLLVGVIVFGVVKESITRKNYHAEYPAPGEMVTIDGHDVHLYCVGEGSPTVVFESDLDQYGVLSWNLVQGEIGKVTRACSYDRAGIMWSEPGPRPRDGETIAAELKAVLETAGEEGPYLLVGHAFGGVYLRIFAGQYPEDVYGMVLLESGHPDMLDQMTEQGAEIEIPEANIRPLILLLSYLGSPNRDNGNPYNLPDQIYAPVQAFIPESSMGWFDEKVESRTTLAQAEAYQSLGDMPLIVIADSVPPSIEGGEAIYEMWVGMQQELTLLSENSELRLDKTGHYPQVQNPDVVIEAIQDLLTSDAGAGE